MHARGDSGGRRFRRRVIELAEGGKLILDADGSISQLNSAGEAVARWASDDVEWPRHAIRFGLLPQDRTTPPADDRERRITHL
jgi:hypothetical protein